MDHLQYHLDVSVDHKTVEVTDDLTGENHCFNGPRALYDALGVLAEWRERDLR